MFRIDSIGYNSYRDLRFSVPNASTSHRSRANIYMYIFNAEIYLYIFTTLHTVINNCFMFFIVLYAGY